MGGHLLPRNRLGHPRSATVPSAWCPPHLPSRHPELSVQDRLPPPRCSVSSGTRPGPALHQMQPVPRVHCPERTDTKGPCAGLPLSQPQRFPREASLPQRAPSGRPVAKKPRTVWGQEHCSCSLPSRPGAGSRGRGSQRCPGQCQPVTGEHRDLKHLARLGRPAPCSLASLHFLGLHLHDPLTSPRQTLKMTLERPV